MNEMVVRVAMAQAGQRWGSFDEEHKSAARELARAAIKAMREPTEAMVEAFRAVDRYEYVHPRDGYPAMIDAALKED